MPAELSSAALMYVKAPVRVKKQGVPYDPTGDVVAVAFMSGRATPTSGDWKTASWETDATTTPSTYFARCLVGSGGATTLVAGLYEMWVKVTDSPEIPVLVCGPLRVT